MDFNRRTFLGIFGTLPIISRFRTWKEVVPARPAEIVPEVITPKDFLAETLPHFNSILDILLGLYEEVEYPVAIPKFGEYSKTHPGVFIQYTETKLPIEYRMEKHWQPNRKK
jgi:hypothetical protein